MRNVLTTCPYCSCGCGLYLQVEGDGIIGVMPSRGHPVAKGKLCVRGWHAHEAVVSPNRLRAPLIRQNGRLREASWEEALDLIARRLREVVGAQGGKSIGVLGSDRCSNENNFLLAKFARAVLGTNNIDFSARSGQAATLIGLSSAFGVGAMPNSIEEVSGADVLLVCGTDLAEQHPKVASELLSAVERVPEAALEIHNPEIAAQIFESIEAGAKLIVVSPRKTQVAELADFYLQPKPGTDVVWINGLIKEIIDQGLADPEIISGAGESYEALAEAVSQFTTDFVVRETGIPAAQLQSAARLYAGAERAMIIYSSGLTRQITGVDSVLSLANLALLTGHIGKPSDGIAVLAEHNNLQGACDMGVMPEFLAGYQRVDDAEARGRFEQTWGVTLPTEPGLPAWEMMGKVRAMLIVGDDPANSLPDVASVRQALEGLEFLIVQDIFLTETGKLADVVLPATSFAEEDGTFTSTERRVQRIRQSIEPRGNCRPPWEIICEIAGRMGYEMEYTLPGQVMEEIAILAPIYAGISYQRLEELGLQWPCPSQDHPGTPILYTNGSPPEKLSFTPAQYQPQGEAPDEEYPFLLVVDYTSFSWQSDILVTNSPTLTREYSIPIRDFPGGFVEMNPRDAEELKVRQGDSVRVISRRGEMQVQVTIGDHIKPKTLMIPFYLRERAAEVLLPPEKEPKAGFPTLLPCAVRVEK